MHAHTSVGNMVWSREGKTHISYENVLLEYNISQQIFLLFFSPKYGLTDLFKSKASPRNIHGKTEYTAFQLPKTTLA